MILANPRESRGRKATGLTDGKRFNHQMLAGLPGSILHLPDRLLTCVLQHLGDPQ